MAKAELLNLGKIYPSDFLHPGEKPRCAPVELKLVMDDNRMVTLEKTAPKDVMWGKYWYRSGINKTMKDELNSIVKSVLSVKNLKADDLWLDIACNDGTLLSYVPSNLIKIGIDPVEDSILQRAAIIANEVVQDYFSVAAYNKTQFRLQKASVVTAIAMFYDLEKPRIFLDDVKDVMHDDGLLVLQLSYTPLMMHQLAFDNIVHEHYAYYTLYTLQDLLWNCGFEIMDCQLNEINGGSFRVYAMKKKGNKKLFGEKAYRDVCKFRIDSLLAHERYQNSNSEETWFSFSEELKALKKTVVDFITVEKKNGKSIWAYGASTKGNTLLQYFELDHNLIDGIADRNPDKWGLHTLGTNIKIHPEEMMRMKKPDYLLILPWHFVSEFIEREKDLLESGTKFIVPCPQFEIIDYEASNI